MARASLPRLLEGRRATERARAALKVGDRLRVTGCAGTRKTVTFNGFDPFAPNWICSKTRNDIHALHVIAVNGVPTTFADPPGFVAPRPTWRERFDYRYGMQIRRLRMNATIWRNLNLPYLRLCNFGLPCYSCGDATTGRSIHLSWRGWSLTLGGQIERPCDEVPF